MTQARISSLNKLQKQKRVMKETSSLQPMTELYLREFFKNHLLKINQKEKQNMFNNSLEVLNLLIEEYQQKFDIQNPCQDASNTHEESIEFEGFYNRLRHIFETLQNKFQQFQVQSSEFQCKSQSRKQKYGQCLFPQNKKIQKTQKNFISSQTQTDEQLYQLVVELKRITQSDSQKIKHLEKELKQKVKDLQKLEEKINFSEQNLKKKQKDNQDLMESLEKTIEEKTSFEKMSKEFEEKWKDLKYGSEKNELLLLLKDQQLKRLQNIERTFIETKTEKEALTDKMYDLNEKFKSLGQEKQKIEQRVRQLETEKQKVKEENTKLRKIIAKKLSLPISCEKNPNKQNMNQNIQTNEETANYIKEMVCKLLKNEKLIDKTVEKQISLFIQNQSKMNAIFTANQPKHTQVE